MPQGNWSQNFRPDEDFREESPGGDSAAVKALKEAAAMLISRKPLGEGTYDVALSGNESSGPNSKSTSVTVTLTRQEIIPPQQIEETIEERAARAG